jgi:hypothetical protein
VDVTTVPATIVDLQPASSLSATSLDCAMNEAWWRRRRLERAPRPPRALRVRRLQGAGSPTVAFSVLFQTTVVSPGVSGGPPLPVAAFLDPDGAAASAASALSSGLAALGPTGYYAAAGAPLGASMALMLSNLAAVPGGFVAAPGFGFDSVSVPAPPTRLSPAVRVAVVALKTSLPAPPVKAAPMS